MADKIRVGLIGAGIQAGWGGSAHARALAELPDYELVAVATRHQDTADEAAREFGAKHAFDDHRKLVECDDVDVVSVVVRVPAHHEIVMAALDAGKHVFCEWPLAANLREAEELAERATQAGVRHIVGLQGRVEPAFVTFRKLIQSGYVGRVLSAKVSSISGGILEREERRAWQVDPALGANVLTIPAGHLLDSFRFAVDEFSEVNAELSTQVREWRIKETNETVRTKSPDTVLVHGTLDQRAVASVHVALVPYHGSGSSIEVYGTEGMLTLTGGRQTHTGEAQILGARGTDGALTPIPIEDDDPPPDSIRDTPAGNVSRLYGRFAVAVRGDSGPIDPDFYTAVELHRLLDAIMRSAEHGTRTRLE